MHEFWRILATVLVAGLVLTIAYGILTFAAAAIHHGRHERREFDRDLNEACGYEAGDGHLRELPARGLDIYTDRNVWLPRTLPPAGDLSPFTPGPVVWTPSRTPITPAEADALRARFLAAQGRPVRVLPDPPVVTVLNPQRADPERPCDCGTRPRHFPAGHDMVTSILDADPKEPAWDVARLAEASVDDIPAAFDTGQIPAVTA